MVATGILHWASWPRWRRIQRSSAPLPRASLAGCDWHPALGLLAETAENTLQQCAIQAFTCSVMVRAWPAGRSDNHTVFTRLSRATFSCSGDAGDVPGRPGEVTPLQFFTRTRRGTSPNCGSDAGDVPLAQTSRGTSSSCGCDAGDVPGQPAESDGQAFVTRFGLGASSSWCGVAGTCLVAGRIDKHTRRRPARSW